MSRPPRLAALPERMATSRTLFAVTLGLSLALGCSSENPGGGERVATSGSDLVASDFTAYAVGQNVEVSYSGFPNSGGDWISIAKTTDPDTLYLPAWQWVTGTSGTVGISTANLSSGTYEARAYYNWHETESFTVRQRSAPFTISTNAVETSLDVVGTLSPVTVTFAGLPGNAHDWIAIAAAGAPATSFVAWQYTNGARNGSMTLPAIATPGRYVARAFVNDTYSMAGTEHAFTVSTVNVTPSLSTFGARQPISVAYSGLPANALDWIALAPKGTPAAYIGQWAYANGKATLTFSFQGLSAGTYEARAYVNDSYVIIGDAVVTVVDEPVTVTPSAASFAAGQPIAVTYTGLPGNAQDWIALAPAGAPATTFGQWMYTGGLANMTFAFAGVSAGTYEARAYLNNSYSIIGNALVTVVDASDGGADGATDGDRRE